MTDTTKPSPESATSPDLSYQPLRRDALPGGLQVAVEQIDAKQWRVTTPLRWAAPDGNLVTVPEGATTDFASTPRAAVWLKPRTGRHTAASVIHDYLWREVCPTGAVSYRRADRVFRQVMHDAGVPLLRRWVAWAAVRLGAVGKGRQWGGWLATLPGALLLVAYAAIFVLPPAMLILPALLLWHLPEWVAFGTQRLWYWLSGRPREDASKLVAPGIDLRT